jgi:very-short-patch-repair endonuclease
VGPEGERVTEKNRIAAADLARETDSAGSELEQALAFQLSARGIRGFKREVEFHPKRKFRFDFAFCAEKLAVEVEGGQYVHGRHQRSGGFATDCIKMAEAALLGWTVLRFATQQVVNGEAADYIERTLRKIREGAR